MGVVLQGVVPVVTGWVVVAIAVVSLGVVAMAMVG